MASRSARANHRWPARTELFAILFAVAILNGVALRISSSLDFGLAIAFASLFGVNAVLWLALYAIFKIGLADAPREPVQPMDKYVAVALLAAALFPVMIAASAALFAASVYLLRSAGRETPLRKLALIALATTGPLLWGPLCLAMLGPEITRLEALLIAAGTGLPTDGNVFRSFDGTATFVVAGGCSALANISMALLLLVVLAQLLDIPLTRRLVPIAIAAVTVTILVNTARLAALGLFPDHLDYLHNGGGRQLFAWAGFVLMGAVTGLGLYRVARDPA